MPELNQEPGALGCTLFPILLPERGGVGDRYRDGVLRVDCSLGAAPSAVYDMCLEVHG